jgi:hypothetical protein
LLGIKGYVVVVVVVVWPYRSGHFWIKLTLYLRCGITLQ